MEAMIKRILFVGLSVWWWMWFREYFDGFVKGENGYLLKQNILEGLAIYFIISLIGVWVVKIIVFGWKTKKVVVNLPWNQP